MHLDCPHCHNPIEVVDEERAEEVVCPSCGSSIQLDPGRTKTYFPGHTPHRLGKFELLELLGMGGFGTVYKARDTELDRIVAIKLPRAGNLASPQDVDRFLREARAAAQLEHPNIVAVHDAGQHEGVCFLVSEYVAGATLADHLAAKKPSFRDAAALVAEIATALDYAHRKGVIHRDLKPSNIMLRVPHEWGLRGRDSPADVDSNSNTETAALDAGTAPRVPVIMDFGLAKRETGEITVTLDGQVLGTPAYMSPEQARGQTHDVDARSDVYSLGVILYELLTGELPFRGNKRMLIMQVLTEEPRPPRRLNDHIPFDLETICLKAMAKDPGRRYTTAAALAADLNRWSNGEPIHARPVGRAERLWRWAKRNPRVAALSASIFLLLAIIAATASISAVIIAGKERAAIAAGALAQENAERERVARERESTARAAAERSFQQARQVVNQFYTRVSEEKLLHQPGLEPLRKDLLDGALHFYLSFIEQRAEDPSVQAELAATYYRVGLIRKEIASKADGLEMLQRAREIQETLARNDPANQELQRDLATTYTNIGLLQRETGRLDLARQSYDRALGITESLARAHPSVAEYQRDRSVCFNKIGVLLSDMGQTAEAMAMYEQARAILEKLISEFPDIPELRSELATVFGNLANILSQIGRLAEALAAYDQSRATYEKLAAEQPNVAEYRTFLAATHINIGNMERATSQPDASIQSYLRAREIQDRLVREHPAVSEFRSHLGKTLGSLGNAYIESGKAADAARCFQSARDLFEKLIRDDPNTTEYQGDLATTLSNEAILHTATGQGREAMRCYDQALQIYDKLIQANPEIADYHHSRVVLFHRIGGLHQSAGRFHEAVRCYESARDVLLRLTREHPAVTQYQSDLAATTGNMALFQKAMGETEQALQSLRQTREVQQTLVAANPTVARFQLHLLLTLKNLGDILTDQKQFVEAAEYYVQARKMCEKLVADNPTISEYQATLGLVLGNIGNLHRAAARPNDSLAAYEQALGVFERLAQEHPSNGEFLRNLALVNDHVGYLHLITDRTAESLQRYERARDIWSKLLTAESENINHHSHFAYTLGQIACCVRKLGRHTDALETCKQAIASQRIAFERMPGATQYRQFLSSHYTTLMEIQRDLGDHAGAAAAAEERRKLWPKSPVELYNVACDLALCVPLVGKGRPEIGHEDLAAQRQYADRAVAVLAESIAAGFRDFEHIRTDTDLDPIRDHAGFKALLEKNP